MVLGFANMRLKALKNISLSVGIVLKEAIHQTES
jgi:hypothetical protein